VNSLAALKAFWMASASRLPAVAPLRIEAVMPSRPREAAPVAFTAVASRPDSPALTLLIEALALSASTVTTGASLLSAAVLARRCGIANLRIN
jgi:hypothetical protein